MHPHLMPRHVGWIEVVTGCMFSGKTEELIKRIRRAQYARQRVVVFKPRIDDRYAEDSVGSHSGMTLREAEHLLIQTTMHAVAGNRTRGAGLLGIGVRTLQRKPQLYDLIDAGRRTS